MTPGQAALLLAAFAPVDAKEEDEVLRRGGVLSHKFPWLPPHLLWTYTVADIPGTNQITVAEAHALLSLSVETGDEVVVRSGTLILAKTLGGLLMEDGALHRASALTGTSVGAIEADLLAAGLDLRRRRLGDVPWRDLSPEPVHSIYTVVETIPRDGQLSVARAQALNPDIRAGDTLRFPNGCEELSRFIDQFEVSSAPAGDMDTESLFIHRRGGIWPEFDADPSVLDSVEPLIALSPVPKLQRLRAEQHLNSLVFEVPQASAEDVLEMGRKLHRDGGKWWPMIVGNEDALTNLRDSSEPVRPVDDVLNSATEVDLREYRAQRVANDPNYYNLDGYSGTWPSQPHVQRLSPLVQDPVWVALVPASEPWMAPAHIQARHNELPPAHVLVAMAREWFERFGAVLIAHAADTMIFELDRTVDLDRTALISLAREAHVYCADAVQQDFGTLEAHAASLGASRLWRLWWD